MLEEVIDMGKTFELNRKYQIFSVTENRYWAFGISARAMSKGSYTEHETERRLPVLTWRYESCMIDLNSADRLGHVADIKIDDYGNEFISATHVCEILKISAYDEIADWDTEGQHYYLKDRPCFELIAK